MHIVQESNQNILIYSPIVMFVAHILDVCQKNHFLLIMFSLFQAYILTLYYLINHS